MAEIYVSDMAEMINDRNAEKARVRNRRKERRNHMAEDWEQEKSVRKDRRLDRVARDSRRKYGHGKTCYWSSNADRKICHMERIARADWKTELCALTEEIECAEFMLESDNEDLEWLNNEIENIGNVDGVIALYEKRIKQLRKSSERKGKLEQYKADTEKRIRNGKEYMRKYNYVREMI